MKDAEDSKRLKCDVLIIGSGVAGATCAILCADKGLDVILVSKAKNVTESNTFYAQGGIIWKGNPDTPEMLARDIDIAGDSIGNESAIKFLCEEGPELVKELLIDRFQIPFSKDEFDKIHLTLEAAYSANRIIHIGDKTGMYIIEALIREIRTKRNIRILADHTVVDLISSTHHAKIEKQFICQLVF